MRRATHLPRRSANTLVTLVSWLAFLAAGAALCFAIWVRVIDPPEGAWVPEATRAVVEPFQGRDTAYRLVDVRHPALLYFWGSECRFCNPAGESLRAFVERSGSGGIPVVALTRDTLVDVGRMRAFAPGIRALRIEGGVPSLGFVTDVPMLVRTRADGSVESAYVGNPTEAVLRQMLPSRQAGP
jgi:hypothetical protein